MTDEVSSIIEELIPLFRQMLRGRYAIALSGSYAKGKQDRHSDLDFYLFADDVMTPAERAALLRPHTERPEAIYLGGDHRARWGVCTDFDCRGYRVEASTRAIELVDRVLAECIAGEIRVEPATWTLRGYYYHCYLSDISIARILDDPHGVLAGWKRQIAVYPPRLRENIVRTHLAQAKVWPDNLHYVSAIARNDVPYVTGIVQQVVHNVIQVLFAMNEVYYGGEKNLLASLRALRYTPAGFDRNLLFLLFPPHEDRVFEKQRELLRAIIADIERELAATG